MTFFATIFAAIALTGVTSPSLRSRAFFDTNNARVGDPLSLTLDFIGEADFASLHPPSLAREVDRTLWRLDDASARTETFPDGRRIVYRVRPLKSGVIWFPALEFTYTAADGTERTARSNAIPVHAREGSDVVVAEMAGDESPDCAMPEPPPLVTDAAADLAGDEDLAFAWRKACASPTADAFAKFDFPAARLNEATCAIREGNVRRALDIYSRLEWQIGQTPEIERGIVAARARLDDNPQAELPAWRQLARPLLRHAWQGRVGFAAGSLAAFVLAFWLCGRLVRMLVSVAVVALALPALAERDDPFALFRQMNEEMDRQHRQMMQQMNSTMKGVGGSFTFSFGGSQGGEQPKVAASCAADRGDIRVGDAFKLVISLESPKNCELGNVSLDPLDAFGLQFTGRIETLANGESANASNVVRRFAVPVRYDIPFRGTISFPIRGMVSRVIDNGRGFRSSFSTSFQVKTAPLEIEIKPLPADNQPADYSGAVAEHASLSVTADLAEVETNDVVSLTFTFRHDGYLPQDWMIDGAAYEIGRVRSGGVEEVSWRGYFIADGKSAAPEARVTYYEPVSKTYRATSAAAPAVKYRPPK